LFFQPTGYLIGLFGVRLHSYLRRMERGNKIIASIRIVDVSTLLRTEDIQNGKSCRSANFINAVFRSVVKEYLFCSKFNDRRSSSNIVSFLHC
jgi:hypothetical protein